MPKSPTPPLKHQLEAVLFVASEPLSIPQLATATASSPEQTTTALNELSAELRGGVRLSVLEDRYRLVTAPELTDTVRSFLQAEAKTELSRAALETLAIIAYRGPLTKAVVDHIRGVSSETMLRNLTARGLIAETGKSPEPGHPPLYAVTHAFLQHFGLTSPAELPPVPQGSSSDAPVPGAKP